MRQILAKMGISPSMEKLSINNFAGLKQVSLEVRPVTGLIGPQASGKSVTAKLLYFLREIASRLPAAVTDGLGAAQYKAECCKRFTRYFPLDNTGASDFEIIYSTRSEHVRVTFTRDEGSSERSLNLEWSNFYPSALEKFTARKQEL